MASVAGRAAEEPEAQHLQAPGAGGRPADRPSPAKAAAIRLTAGERRDQLFDVALRLFAERGYEATTMDEIAEAAGVTKPLLYQHFSSKRSLYLELVDSVSRALLDAVSRAAAAASGPREQVEEGFAAYFRLVVANETAFRLLYGRNHPMDTELDDALRRVEEAIAEAIDPLIAAGLDPEHRRFLAHAVVGMAEGASRHWLESDRAARRSGGASDVGAPGGDEAQRLARRLANLAWAGLRSVHAD
jgi:AcrR family transcriptional regulator